MTLTRREFLQAVAASTAGAVAFTGCAAPGSVREFQIQSSARLPESTLPGQDSWYASLYRDGGAGLGVIVRIVNGRAQKLEGNPDYPVNLGRLSARAQAAVQELYHPDRLAGPLRLSGVRGSGQFQAISWEEGLNELVRQLRDLAGRNQAGSALLVMESERGHRALLAERFARSYGAQLAKFEPLDRRASVREATRRVFGFDQIPEFDVAGARYVLSFGADFLGTWLSPVHYGWAYGQLRQGWPDTRGRLVQVEPRMSQTGSVADEWVPVQPGAEGILALSIAQALAASGKADQRALAALTGNAGAAALDAFNPESTASVTGVSAEHVTRIARELGEVRPALVIGGDAAGAHTNGTLNLVAIYALNLLVGNVGAAGGIRPNPPSPLTDLSQPAPSASFADWRRLLDDMRGGRVNLLMVHRANPVYGLPAAIDPREAVGRVPFVVSFSSFMDETTAMADLVLPDHHFLEDWGDDVPDPGPGYQIVGFQQPVVVPQLNTRSFANLLLTVANELGGEVARALPWGSLKDALQQAAQELRGLNRGSVPAGGVEAYWTSLLQQGGWWDTASAGAPPEAGGTARLPTQPPLPAFEGTAQEYPFFLHVFPSAALGTGEMAHLPWLQGLPDPNTTVVWRTWVEVNPKTAADLSLTEGDVVAVESPAGSIQAPVYVYPAIRPDVVAMPLGQGHTAYGRYASNRGANPLDILAPRSDAETGTLAWAATRVRLRKTGERLTRLPKFEGNVTPFVPENIPMVLKPGQQEAH